MAKILGVNAESAVECLNDGDEEGPAWRSTLFPEQKLDLYRLGECFRVLERYSFVQWRTDQESYVMHKLVHASATEALLRRSIVKVVESIRKAASLFFAL
jgi:hypothetical protein